MAGPERTFIVLTLPSVSTTASMLTLPAIRCVRATAGYTGGTDLTRRAALTSPPTSTGATGCLVLADNDDRDSAPGVGMLVPNEGSASPDCGEFLARLTTGAERRTAPRLGFFGCSAGGSLRVNGGLFFGAVAGRGETAGVVFFAGSPETGENVADDEFEPAGGTVASGLATGGVFTATIGLETGASTVFAGALPELPPRVWRMYHTPPPASRSAAAASPRNNPFFELPAVEASCTDSSDSSSIFPPKGASSELASGSTAGRTCDAVGSLGPAGTAATSAGAAADGPVGTGAGGAMCDSGASQPGILDCSEAADAGVGTGAATDVDSAFRESGASQSGTFTSSTCSMSYALDFAAGTGFGSGLGAGSASCPLTSEAFRAECPGAEPMVSVREDL